MGTMGKVIHILLFAATVTASAASCLGRCGIALNLGNVGSCKFWGCSKSRGPTHCTLGSCFCNDGYCRYPVTTLHVQSRTCRQRAGHDSCHATRVCYNAGLLETTCSGGLCFCKFGYKYNCFTKKCENRGDYESLASSMTAEELAEVKAEGARETMYNVAGFAIWICVAFAAVIGGIVFMRKRSRAVETPEMLLG